MIHPPEDLLSAFRAFRQSLRPSPRIYVAGCSGEPLALFEALKAEPKLAADVTFLGMWIPGVNTCDWTSLHPTARAETIFATPALRTSIEAGRTDFLPLSYVQAERWLAETDITGAVVLATPPDASGLTSLGVAADFTQTVLARPEVRVFALANAAMPRPRDTVTFKAERAEVWCADTHPVLSVPAAPTTPEFKALAANVAGLIRNGDTLQFGLGSLQQALLEALTHHHSLRVHSGMVSEALIGLLDAGAIANEPGAITTGVALGSPELYARVAADPRVQFRPVSHTHQIATLAAIPCLKAINSVISMDLFGQANAEFIKGRQVSGTGGLVDFLRGAAASPHGRGILAFLSSAAGGQISRIVPHLDPDAVSIARADVGTVVTEYGVAELSGTDMDTRAERLISIAHPDHQGELANSWTKTRSRL